MSAVKLTPPQERALDWLPGDAEAAPVSHEAVEKLQPLCRLKLAQTRWVSGDPTQSGYWEANITPAGLALRAERNP